MDNFGTDVSFIIKISQKGIKNEIFIVIWNIITLNAYIVFFPREN